MEVQNQGEGYLYRGEIETIEVYHGSLTVSLAWNAKEEGYPVPTGRWMVHEDLDFAVTLEFCSVTESGKRMVIQNTGIGEIATLFPKGGSRLNPNQVEGMQLASTN